MFSMRNQSQFASQTLRPGPRGTIDRGGAYGAIVFVVFVGYFSTFVLESPIRYLLTLIGAEWVIYLRDIVILITTAVILWWGALSKGADVAVVVVINVLLFHSLVAMIYVGNLFQTAFGLKLFLPLIFGMAAYPYLEGRLERFTKPFVWLFVFVCVGMGINYFVDFPWKGLEYSVGDVTLMTAKDWYAMGMRRLYGFSRTSASVATQALLLACFLVVFLRSAVAKALAWIFAAVVILLSTTKGVFVAYLALSLFFIGRKAMPQSSRAFNRALFLVLATVVILPCVSLFVDPKSAFMDQLLDSVLQSFAERITFMWPSALDLLLEKGNAFLGRGIGGAGVAQLLFEGRSYHPGDNLFVYGYLLLGAMSVVYLTYVVAKAQFLRLDQDRQDVFYFCVLGFYFVYGLTTSVPESGELSLFFGLTLGHLVRLERRDADLLKGHARDFTSFGSKKPKRSALSF